MKISAQLVKELREKTSAGILDCKKALTENNGDLDKSIKWLREKGIAQASKKNSRVTAEGVISVASKKDIVTIFEVNSETDFVARNDKFLKLIDIISKLLLSNPDVMTVEEVLNLQVDNTKLNDIILEYAFVIGEKLSLRRFNIFKLENNQSYGMYIHNQRLGSVVIFDGKASEQDGKQIAMHIAAMSPKFISKKDVSEDYINNERDILNKKALLENKPKNIIDKIVAGGLNKALAEVCLLDQNFVVDPSMKISKFLQSKNLEIIKMVRFEVGEGIEKITEDFATEVMKQVKK